MACKHFEEGRTVKCRAVSGTLIPSVYEREQFCRTDENDRCPTFRLYQLRSAPLPQEAYYGLWVDGSADPPRSAAV
jgi:hypothetical protein